MTVNDLNVFELHEAELDGSAEEVAARVHASISEALGFPSYYGGNLSALSDCLGDLCEPTLVVVELADEDSYGAYAAFSKGGSTSEPRWIDRFIRVLERSARGSDALEVVVTRAVG